MAERRDWMRLHFAGLGHYAEERLGMPRRRARRLTRALRPLPAVAAACASGRISMEAAALIHRMLGDEPVGADVEAAWVEHASAAILKRMRSVRGRSTGPTDAIRMARVSLQLPRDVPESSRLWRKARTAMEGRTRPPFPAWLRWAVTLFVTVFVATHASYGNLINLLWLSDVALLGALFALWRGSRLVASMMLLGVLLLDGVGWTLDFLVGGLTGRHPLEATRYMFDARVPALVRALSLFHLWLPALLLWMVRRLGYDRRALPAQTALTWTLLAITYAATSPERNLNWVFGPGHVQTLVPAWLYLLAEMAVFPLVFYLPVHLLLRKSGRNLPRE